jgi:NCS1 family nucleobase:cation symporter-1
VTLIAGAIATIAGLFPAFAMKLLRFVVLYGFILAPVAAIIVFDVFLSPRFKVQQNYAEYSGSKFNWAVMLEVFTFSLYNWISFYPFWSFLLG